MAKEKKLSQDVKQIKRYGEKLLKDAGLWRPELTYQLEMLAVEIATYRKAYQEVLTLDKFTITENSREGDDRLRTHPAVAAYQAQANQLRQDLKVLLMNFDKTDNSQIKKEENVLAEVLAKIDKDEDEEED